MVLIKKPLLYNNMTVTLNKMGYMMEVSDPYRDAFIEYAKNATLPLLDIGAAYGIATIAAMKKGACVIANDIDDQHLEILKNNVPEDLKALLRCHAGRFPNDLSFPNNSLAGVLISQVLHFLTGEEILVGLEKIYKWLQPGGKVFAVTGTPYMKMIQSLIPLYEEKKLQGNPWPGYIENIRDYYSEKHSKNIPEKVHLMDQEILEKAFRSCNYQIEKISTFARPDFDEEVRLDGRENVGIIAVKN